jgi:hypothetical protein
MSILIRRNFPGTAQGRAAIGAAFVEIGQSQRKLANLVITYSHRLLSLTEKPIDSISSWTNT